MPMTRRRAVVRAVVHRAMVVPVVCRIVMHRPVMYRVVHDDHATRLRHRQCGYRQRRDSQYGGNKQLLHETPLLVGNCASMQGAA